MSRPILVCNTSPLLYLGRIQQAQLLAALYEEVHVPEAVLLELDAGRLLRPETIEVRSLPWLTIVQVSESSLARLPANRLGAGERQVLALALEKTDCHVGLDDRPARALAQRLGLRVVGTLGILIKAKRANLLPVLGPTLNALQEEGFRISEQLYQEALNLAGE